MKRNQRNRINKIRKHPVYQQALKRIEELEKNRIYCRHTMEHFLDVARISFIITLEENVRIEKEIIYAAALLHDIGRFFEYEGKCSHESGSIVLALKILPECGFSIEEQNLIISAIAEHRKKDAKGLEPLGSILRRADKLSRLCYQCQASDTCNWDALKRNDDIVY